jgi:hypothetical protein
VFLVLLSSVGLSFFAVSTTAPLLQRWFGGTRHRQAGDPFFLYAASNFGSIGALLIYPIVVEPHLELSTQARVWFVGYGLLLLLTVACAIAWNPLSSATKMSARLMPSEPAIPRRTRLHWIALAAVPSSLMLSVTTHITTDIAPVPLLWVIPLTIYLGTYVIAFSARTTVVIRISWLLLPVVVFIPLATILTGMAEPPGFILFHLVAFALAATVCHGQLAASRPGVRHLTEFYVWLAIGGAVGGLFNVLVAPSVFHSLAEYPLALVAACLLRGSRSEVRAGVRIRDGAIALSLGFLALLAQFTVATFLAPPGSMGYAVYVFAIPAALALLSFRNPLPTGLAIGAIALAVGLYPNRTELVVARHRSFFGIQRIVNQGSYRLLLNGTTNHGSQSLRSDRRCTPLSYYYPTGPLGQMFASFSGVREKWNIGVIGLGTGSTGGYARPGQAWTFYEIDPAVERIARNRDYFTYLRDCAPQAHVVIGDARLSLTHQPDGLHDVIIVDAFSSDAVPLHLLTREALDLYLRKLKLHGLLAFHISNRYVNLRRVLARVARDERLVAIIRSDEDVTATERYDGKLESVWVIMARSGNDIGSPLADRRWRVLPPDVTGRSWTDSYSNVFETLKLRF